MNTTKLMELLKNVETSPDFFERKLRLKILERGILEVLKEGKTVRITSGKKTHTISPDVNFSLSSHYDVFRYGKQQRITTQGILGIEVDGESSSVGYRFQESIPEHVNRIGESIRYVTDARSILLKRLAARQGGVELTAADLKREGISWELAGTPIEKLMWNLRVTIEGSTLVPEE